MNTNELVLIGLAALMAGRDPKKEMEKAAAAANYSEGKSK